MVARQVVIPEGYTEIIVGYGDKYSKILVPNNLPVADKRQYFDRCRESVLAEEKQAEVKAALATAGIDVDALRKRDKIRKKKVVK